MKPAPFIYQRPESVGEMLELLREHGEDAKILAGGQSLVAAMNFRLARPSMLLDCNKLTEIANVRSDGNVLKIGALSRHAAFHKPVVEAPLGLLLSKVVRHIAHFPIRQRGTFGGSLAHADPASEWCLVTTVLNADLVMRSSAGERIVPAQDFFKGTFTTALRPDELLTEIRLPMAASDMRSGFCEFSRRAGDFALTMALATLRIVGGKIAAVQLGIGGVADKAIRLESLAQSLVGLEPSEANFRDVAQAASESLEPTADIHGSSEYRRDLIKAMVRRALMEAAA